MDLWSIGSANRYAKNMARRTQWNLKKQSGDFAGHKKSLGDYVNMTKASSVLPQDETDHKMSAIMAKAQAGKKLSPDDWEYLKQKNPTLYEKLRQAEEEQENYEKALRRCKTRDEAQRLHVSKLADIMTAAKSGDESALYRLNRLTRTMIAFTESDEYKKMPTEAEEAIARESERQAERDALREEAARKEAEKAERENSEADADADAVSETDADAESVAGTEADAEAVSETDADGETTPESVSEAAPEGVSEKNADAKSKADTAPRTDAKVKAPRTDAKPKDAPEVETAKNAAPEVKASKADAVSVSPRGSASATAVVSPGQRAYLAQRDAKPRRREIDAKA